MYYDFMVKILENTGKMHLYNVDVECIQRIEVFDMETVLKV